MEGLLIRADSVNYSVYYQFSSCVTSLSIGYISASTWRWVKVMMSYIVFQYTAPCQGRPPTEHTARLSTGRGMCFDCYTYSADGGLLGERRQTTGCVAFRFSYVESFQCARSAVRLDKVQNNKPHQSRGAPTIIA
jgi:hypothetical protein